MDTPTTNTAPTTEQDKAAAKVKEAIEMYKKATGKTPYRVRVNPETGTVHFDCLNQ